MLSEAQIYRTRDNLKVQGTGFTGLTHTKQDAQAHMITIL